jgi:hypothetical protein
MIAREEEQGNMRFAESHGLGTVGIDGRVKERFFQRRDIHGKP